MLPTFFLISVVFNAVIITTLVFIFVEFKRKNDMIMKNQNYIQRLKHQIFEYEQEIREKEAKILNEKTKGNWTIQFFYEEHIISGFIKSKYVVRYRFQLLHNGFPVGPAGIIKEETLKEVDKKIINQVLNDFAKPVIDAGLKVAIKSISD